LFFSNTNVKTGQCVPSTIVAGSAGKPAACPAATPADTYSGDVVSLDGPIPPGGGSLTSLEATSSVAPTGTQNYLVEVVDNTTGATLLSCTVNSTSSSFCTNTASVALTAGHYIEVRITENNGATDASWRVVVRY
jgi:hypothetical protein